MYETVKGLWQMVPDSIQDYVMSINANLTTGAFSKREKDEFEPLFNQALREGYRYFTVAFGPGSYGFVPQLLDVKVVRDFFIDILWKDGEGKTGEDLKKIIIKKQIPLDRPDLEDLDFDKAIRAFLDGFQHQARKNDRLSAFMSRIQVKEISISCLKIEKDVSSIKKDIKEFVKLQKSKPPDIEALKNIYYRYIHEKLGRLSTKGFTSKALSIPLTEIYIRLDFSEEQPEESPDVLEEDLLVEKAFSEIRSQKKESDLFSDMMASPYSVVPGGPGSGKSTFLKYLALAFADGAQKQRLGMEQNLMPVYFPISAYAGAYEKTAKPDYPIWKFLTDFFIGEELTDMTDLFDKASEDGRAIFLIDGLDEVRDEWQRKRMIDRIRSFILSRNRPGNRFIITCRTASYKESARFDSIEGQEFSVFKVQPFGIPRIEDFLLKYYRFYHRDVLEEVTAFEAGALKSREKMMGIIRKDQNILSIATNPLMLFILSMVEQKVGELPRSRAGLYSECLKMFAGRWEMLRNEYADTRKDLRLGGLINMDFIIEYLGPIAKDMHDSAARTIEYPDLKKRLADRFESRNKDPLKSKQEADAFIGIMKEQSGLIREVSPALYGFSHQTFKEYLTAKWLAENSRNLAEDLGGSIFEPEWLEVVRLAFAELRKPEAEDFIKALLEMKKSSFEKLIISGKCVIDAGREKIPDDLYETMYEAIKSEVFKEGVSTERAPLAEVLGWLGDDRKLEEWVTVAAGIYRFERGDQEISKFQMGKYPVHNGWFRLFAENGGYECAEFWSEEGQKWLEYTHVTHPMYWHDKDLTCPSSPVIGVCWYEADAFCRWLTQTRKDGYAYILPDENQWEAAAAGFENREYPWGNWKEDACNIYDSKIRKTSLVGIFTKGDTPEGISDLAGNVWEWTKTDNHSKKPLTDFRFDVDLQKLLDDKKFDELRPKLKEKDPQLPMLRGGSWYNDRYGARCASRGMDDPYSRNDLVGFRCVRTLK
ncbi:MAG: hypothetical protein SRB2_01854 [Desulfobacteraceae bacterium Eth-SRB2]|nr:MAG: hypothetical protein SRB2_01854 [Desulfobacteraceae bacterium Eth-SRB2]